MTIVSIQNILVTIFISVSPFQLSTVHNLELAFDEGLLVLFLSSVILFSDEKFIIINLLNSPVSCFWLIKNGFEG